MTQTLDETPVPDAWCHRSVDLGDGRVEMIRHAACDHADHRGETVIPHGRDWAAARGIDPAAYDAAFDAAMRAPQSGPGPFAVALVTYEATRPGGRIDGHLYEQVQDVADRVCTLRGLLAEVARVGLLPPSVLGRVRAAVRGERP